MNDIVIRELGLADLEAYRYWKDPAREHNKYNGPYYPRDRPEELDRRIAGFRKRLDAGERDVLGTKKVVADATTDELIGEVNRYWKSEETLWMEVGLVIFNERYWGRGLGAVILSRWITEVFAADPRLVRLGVTTWSGNLRMMRLAEKLGMKKEAVYRKARIVGGAWYDSVSYGVLREEWEAAPAR